jgi:hypothetical protein
MPLRDSGSMDAGSSPDSGQEGEAPQDGGDVTLEPGSLGYASSLVELGARGVFTVRVEVPDDAHAFVFTATPPAGDFWIGLARVDAPSGTLFPPNASRPVGQTYLPDQVSGSPGLPYSFTMPNRPELELEHGTYVVSFQVLPSSSGAVSADVTWVRGAAQPTGGRLDLLLLAFPSQGPDASSVLNDPTFVRAIEHANTLFAPAGIQIGDVAGVDVVLEATGATGEDTALLRAVLDEHVARAPTAMRVALLEHLSAGKSYGVPGAPGRPGLLRSSTIAIGPSFLSWPADIAGRLFAHEIAHQLGLSHVSEMDFSTHDQLLDTPECSPEEQLSEDDAGAALDDACDQARRNVMYWKGFSPLPLDDVYFSQDQIWVMRRSPFLR